MKIPKKNRESDTHRWKVPGPGPLPWPIVQNLGPKVRVPGGKVGNYAYVYASLTSFVEFWKSGPRPLVSLAETFQLWYSLEKLCLYLNCIENESRHFFRFDEIPLPFKSMVVDVRVAANLASTSMIFSFENPSKISYVNLQLLPRVIKTSVN